MKQVLILIWFLITAAPSWASTCEASLLASQKNVVIKQIEHLNPKLKSQAAIDSDWQTLYVQLKQEEKYAEGGLFDPDLKKLILKNQSKHYDLKNLNDEDLRQFYVNALRSLYVRVASFWTHEQLVQLAGGELHPDIEKIASRILESTSSPWSLKDRELTPAAAAEYFKNKEWNELPWPQLLKFLGAWKKHSPYSYSPDQFSKFWDLHAATFQLDFSLFSRIQLAMSGFEKSLFCCLSEPGCANCPHNRRWLKP